MKDWQWRGMSATDELRRSLDLLGIGWEDGTDGVATRTRWGEGGRATYSEWPDGSTHLLVSAMGADPDEAADHALCRGECHVTEVQVQDVRGEPADFGNEVYLLSCDHTAYVERPSFCPECGRRVIGA